MCDAPSPFAGCSFPVDASNSIGGGRSAEVRVGATAATFEYRDSCADDEGLLLMTVSERRGWAGRAGAWIDANCTRGCAGVVNDSGSNGASDDARGLSAAAVAAVVGDVVRGESGARRGDAVLEGGFRALDPRGEIVVRLELRTLRPDTALMPSTDAISDVVPLPAAPGATGFRGERVTPRCRLLVEAFSAACPPWFDAPTPSLPL